MSAASPGADVQANLTVNGATGFYQTKTGPVHALDNLSIDSRGNPRGASRRRHLAGRSRAAPPFPHALSERQPVRQTGGRVAVSVAVEE
jgi:hypothetical protein